MKEETRKGLEAASLELRKEIIAYLAANMRASQFCGALADADGDLTTDGQEIADFMNHCDDDEFTGISDDDAHRLHEAICEGRRQDAIDILNEMSEWRLRSVAEQRNLFPDRVPSE